MDIKKLRKLPKGADLSQIHPDLRLLAVPITALSGHPDNPRKHPDANKQAIAGSLRKYLQRKPVVANVTGAGLRIEAGHGVYGEMLAAGAQYIACTIVEDDPVTELGFMLADNRTGDLSEDDPEKLAPILRQLIDAGEDVDEIGWNDAAVQALLKIEPDKDDSKTDDDSDESPVHRADELQKEWQTERGQVWEIPSVSVPGRCHRVVCGNSLDPAVIALALDGLTPDGVWSDAPYGMRLDADYSGAKSGLKMAGKHLSGGRKYANVIGDHEDFDPTLLLAMTETVAEQFWWGADYYAERLPDKNEGSWLVWDKRLDESADRMYGSCFELCWSKARHKRDMIRIKWAGVFGTEKEAAIVGKTKRVHPTQKPIALFEWCAQKYLPGEGKVWLDPFAGSGISLLGAERLGQIACCIELSEAYVAVILERARKQGLEPRLLNV